jgi:hypothetical protein
MLQAQRSRIRVRCKYGRNWFGLTDGGWGSNPHHAGLVLSAFLMLVFFAYLKNCVLTTSEPSRCLGRKGGHMRKLESVARCTLGSVSEVTVALGVGLLASAGPLSQANSRLIVRPTGRSPAAQVRAGQIKRWVTGKSNLRLERGN